MSVLGDEMEAQISTDATQYTALQAAAQQAVDDHRAAADAVVNPVPPEKRVI